jgi:hypothetical protein
MTYPNLLADLAIFIAIHQSRLKNWFLVLLSSAQQITTLTTSIHQQCLQIAGGDFLFSNA